MLVHVEPQSTVSGTLGQIFDVTVERPEDAASAMRDVDEDALDPEEHAVPPVAPLECNRQLSDRDAVLLRDEVAALRRVLEQGSEHLLGRFPGRDESLLFRAQDRCWARVTNSRSPIEALRMVIWGIFGIP